MKGMKSIILVMIVLFLTVGTVFSNGQSEKSTDDEIVSINYYGKNNEDLERAIISEYEARNPGVKVNYIPLVGGSNERLAQIQTVLQAESSDADVFAADGIWPPIFIAAGWVSPYDELGMDISLFDDYMMVSNFMYDGKHYGIPFQANAGMMFYRKDLLDKYGLKVPTTSEDLKTAAGTILAGEKNPDLLGFAASWKQGEGLSCAAHEYFAEYGISVVDNGASDIDKTSVKEALDFMTGLVDADIAPVEISSFGSEQRTLYKQGNLVFSRDWVSAFAAHYFKADGNDYHNVAGAAVLPGEGGVAGNWGLMVSAFSENKEEAAKFAQFRANKEMLIKQYEMIGALPPHYNAFADSSIQSLLGEYADEILAVFENTVNRAVTPYYGEVSNIIQINTHAALTGLITTDQAAQLIEKEVKRIVD